jgi:poly(3-hydroxybutyrate) depolymerase
MSEFLQRWALVIAALGVAIPGGLGSAHQPAAGGAGEIVLREGLVLRAGGRQGRTSLPTDPLQHQVVLGQFTAPQAGDRLTLPDGSARTWERAQAGADGTFAHPALAGGYLYFSVPSDADQVLMLEAAGHGMVYVNGEPRVGDMYSTGYVKLPVFLKKGTNDFLFAGGRGRLKAKLVPPPAGVFFDLSDVTAPDLREGQAGSAVAGVVLVNATTQPLRGLASEAHFDGELRDDSVPLLELPVIPPLTTRKVAVPLKWSAPKGGEQGAARVRLQRANDRGQAPAAEAKLVLRIRKPHQTYKQTFVSGIDGSVQYFAVNPQKAAPGGRRPALFVSLHGAGVEAIGQADAYGPKDWGVLVAPTNRRPFGFDWEDWGRLDALEVLDLAQREFGTDPRRTYLTGHSMGGHGTWHLGVTFPDRFAAIAPSAGWVSMWSYAGARRAESPSPVLDLLQRAMNASDTLALVRNTKAHGVYVLHGDADDNVPVDQARTMRRQLGEFHADWAYYERPGAGHWWGGECVDWPPLFEFLARHVSPERKDVRHVEFTTANPGVSAWCHWACIEAQLKSLLFSRIDLRCDPAGRKFSGVTENVARLALDVGHLEPGKPISVELDGQKLDGIAYPEEAAVARGQSDSTGPRLWFARTEGKWTAINPPPPGHKGPHRAGPFKDAFRHRVLFVYGTQGSPAENAWAYAKARYDAESFWYRGNGSIDLVADKDFDPRAEPDRNVILYGHAKLNAAWKLLLGDSPILVEPGRVRVGDREVTGEDLACLFLRPRPGSDRASVGVVAGTGLVGLRLTDRVPYFVSGIGYPDYLVFDPEALLKGATAVRAAGYFGADWSVDAGEAAWAK